MVVVAKLPVQDEADEVTPPALLGTDSAFERTDPEGNTRESTSEQSLTSESSVRHSEGRPYYEHSFIFSYCHRRGGAMGCVYAIPTL